MKRRNKILVAFAACVGLAALAVGQVRWNGGSGPIFYDRSFGTEMAVRQLWSHAQSLESAVQSQREEIAELKKDLQAEKDKAAKLEKRVRAMELRGK